MGARDRAAHQARVCGRGERVFRLGWAAAALQHRAWTVWFTTHCKRMPYCPSATAAACTLPAPRRCAIPSRPPPFPPPAAAAAQGAVEAGAVWRALPVRARHLHAAGAPHAPATGGAAGRHRLQVPAGAPQCCCSCCCSCSCCYALEGAAAAAAMHCGLLRLQRATAAASGFCFGAA